MPSKTDKQHRAMEAAAHGNSTLGIPQSVGQKFVAADAGKKGMATGGLVPAGKRLVDHGDHFKVHSKDGKVHTIAKKGLHPSTVKHLQKFAEGGQVQKYATKGEVELPPGTEPVGNESAVGDSRIASPEAEAADEAARGEGQFGAPQPEESKKAEDELYSQEQYNESMKPDMPGQEVKVGEPSPIQGGAIGAAPSGGDMPPGAEQPAVTSENVGSMLGKFGSAKVHGISDEERAQTEAAAGARTENAKTQEELAKQTEAINNQKVATFQKLQADSDAKMDVINKRADQLRADIENGKIDPNHYWHEKGTGGRIMASIGLLLSGIGSGLGGGPNMAMQVIQSNIKRDIDAQEQNLKTKQSLLADTYRQTGDLRLARQMAEHTATNVALAQLNTIAAKSSSAQAKAIAQVANAQGRLLLAQQARGIADRQSANDMAAHNANVGAQNALLMQQAKKGDMAGKTPREMQGAKISTLEASRQDIQKHMDDIEKGFNGPLGSLIAKVPGAQWTESGSNTIANDAMAHALAEKLATALGGGAATTERIKELTPLIPLPSDARAVREQKQARLNTLIDTQLQAYRSQQGGVGFNVAPPTQFTPAAPSLKR